MRTRKLWNRKTTFRNKMTLNSPKTWDTAIVLWKPTLFNLKSCKTICFVTTSNTPSYFLMSSSNCTVLWFSLYLFCFTGHKHQSPLYNRLRLRGDKSTRSEDMEADDEQETTTKQKIRGLWRKSVKHFTEEIEKKSWN